MTEETQDVQDQELDEEYFKVCAEVIDEMSGRTKNRILFKAVQMLAESLKIVKACPVDNTERCRKYDYGCVNCWTDWVIGAAEKAVKAEITKERDMNEHQC